MSRVRSVNGETIPFTAEEEAERDAEEAAWEARPAPAPDPVTVLAQAVKALSAATGKPLPKDLADKLDVLDAEAISADLETVKPA